MTKSTVCVESFSREHMKLTVLFDPLDGPFTTNHHTQLHQPIFFRADIWATNMGPDEATRSRSCMMNVADGSKTLDEIFSECAEPPPPHSARAQKSLTGGFKPQTRALEPEARAPIRRGEGGRA